MIEYGKDNYFDLSVILLTFNEIGSIGECISSLFSHSKDFTLFIFDNCSTDGTIEYLMDLKKSRNNVIVYLNNENIGIVKGRNEAYKILTKNIRTDYVMFLDVDQVVCEGWQESYFGYINNGYDIIGSEAWRLNDVFYPFYKCKNPRDLFTYVGCGGMLTRMSIVDSIGLFDERFSPMYFEDPDFCFRAHRSGYKIAWCHDKIIHKPHKLLDEKKRQHFMNSYVVFKKKHFGESIPIFSMISVDK